jgi:4'-phosphopantetheinyl transferase EntD
MIEDILPRCVASAEHRNDDDDDDAAGGVIRSDWRLYPEEAAAVATATARRRREFAATRACARAALERLGRRPVAIGRNQDGSPQWPAGVTGSLTHCSGYRAAAVAHQAHVPSVGIDAEPHLPLSAGLLDVIATRAERDHLTALRRRLPSVHWDRLLFSAKESVFKAWFPLTGTWLDFADATLGFEVGSQTFSVRLRRPGPVTLTGRWLAGADVVVTVVLPAPIARQISSPCCSGSAVSAGIDEIGPA